MTVQYATVTEVNTLFIIFISPNTSARLCLEIINSLIIKLNCKRQFCP